MTHREEALKHIDWTHDWQQQKGFTEAAGIATALLAQAHATLELAEQQRIANVVALASGARVGQAGFEYGAREYLIRRDSKGLPVIAPEVAEALGIEDTK